MTDNLKSAKGHAKNARNQLGSMLTKARADEAPDEESVEYALEEVKTAIEKIEAEI